MASYPDVNGHRTSYASIEFNAGTFGAIYGLKSINYKGTTEIPKVKGNSAVPIGRPRGNSDYDGDIEIYEREWKKLLPYLSRNRTIGFSESAHTINVSYHEAASPEDTVLDTLYGVRFMAPERSHSEGPDILVLKVPLSIMRIKWDGYVDIRQSFGV